MRVVVRVSDADFANSRKRTGNGTKNVTLTLRQRKENVTKTMPDSKGLFRVFDHRSFRIACGGLENAKQTLPIHGRKRTQNVQKTLTKRCPKTPKKHVREM